MKYVTETPDDYLDGNDHLKLSFDIIAILETWAEPNTTEDILLNVYEVFHVARAN